MSRTPLRPLFRSTFLVALALLMLCTGCFWGGSSPFGQDRDQESPTTRAEPDSDSFAISGADSDALTDEALNPRLPAKEVGEDPGSLYYLADPGDDSFVLAGFETESAVRLLKKAPGSLRRPRLSPRRPGGLLPPGPLRLQGPKPRGLRLPPPSRLPITWRRPASARRRPSSATPAWSPPEARAMSKRPCANTARLRPVSRSWRGARSARRQRWYRCVCTGLEEQSKPGQGLADLA